MLKQIIIDKISIQQKTGRKGPFLQVGIQCNGKNVWMNGTDTVGGISTNWKQGERVLLNIYEDSWIGNDEMEKKGWKWRFPRKEDLLEERVEKLENEVFGPKAKTISKESPPEEIPTNLPWDK